MNCRQRVSAALDHREPDRVPLDLGVAQASRFSKQAYRNLQQFFNMDNHEPYLASKLSQLVYANERLLEKLEVDVRSPAPVYEDILEEWEDEDYYFARDAWRIVHRMPKQEGSVYSMIGHPLADKEPSFDDIYGIPPVPEKILTHKEKLKRFRDQNYPVVFPYHFGNGFFQMGCAVYGFEQWLTMLVLDKKRAVTFQTRLLEAKRKFWNKIISHLDSDIDVLGEADDLGTQQGLFLSPEMFRELVKPFWKALFDEIKRKTKAKIFFHSCGAISELIPDFIEMGVDILNPLQTGAKGMEPKGLKKRYGESLVFWGGGIDTQGVLVQGSASEIQDAVARSIDALAPGGGYVFSPTHNIQPDVPIENFIVMWEAFLKRRSG